MADALLATLLAYTQNLPANRPLLLGLDGRSAAGKSSLAARFAQKTGAFVVHTDDFCRPVTDRENAVAGHMDLLRLKADLLAPLSLGADGVYQSFDCKTQALLPPIPLSRPKILLVEGAYATHPLLRDLYDATFFLDISPALQFRRLQRRNPAALDAFLTRWLPAEEIYFASCDVKSKVDCLMMQ